MRIELCIMRIININFTKQPDNQSGEVRHLYEGSVNLTKNMEYWEMCFAYWQVVILQTK